MKPNEAVELARELIALDDTESAQSFSHHTHAPGVINICRVLLAQSKAAPNPNDGEFGLPFEHRSSAAPASGEEMPEEAPRSHYYGNDGGPFTQGFTYVDSRHYDRLRAYALSLREQRERMVEVPREPTREMLEAAQECDEGEDDPLAAFTRIYKSMLAAAPFMLKEGK